MMVHYRQHTRAWAENPDTVSVRMVVMLPWCWLAFALACARGGLCFGERWARQAMMASVVHGEARS